MSSRILQNSVAVALVGVCVAIPVCLKIKAGTQLADKKRTLAEQAVALDTLNAEVGQLSNSAAVVENERLSPDALREVVRLRAEIAQLRTAKAKTDLLRRQKQELTEKARQK